MDWSLIIDASKNCDGDEYDELGRNISANKRRESLYPWNVVYRKTKKR
tara:strand:+ start:405 stop:548 length:144 start_codon:yes stop_codon:yes gene_type:complete